MRKKLILTALLLLTGLGLSAAFKTYKVIQWNREQTALIRSEYAKLVGDQTNCIMVAAKHLYTCDINGGYDEVQSIEDVTAFDIWRRWYFGPSYEEGMACRHDTPFRLVVVIYSGERWNRPYNWSFSQGTFVRIGADDHHNLSNPQNSDNPICSLWNQL